ncbi:MAG: hypothetical protein EPO61_03660 [Nitrospirae bacterium]|nr:MAG: hypothetical protein EPO61_03660 [Nitrospirota bacterium]
MHTPRRTIFGRAFLLPAVCWFATACASLPTTSLSGEVHDILITEDRVSPQDLIVHIGDEVRWVNHRLSPIWVYFFRDSLDEVSCARGFSLFWANEEEAVIEPGQSVSVCFSKEDAISYTVQSERTVIRGSTAGEGGSFKVPQGLHAAVIVEVPPARTPR